MWPSVSGFSRLTYVIAYNTSHFVSKKINQYKNDWVSNLSSLSKKRLPPLTLAHSLWWPETLVEWKLSTLARKHTAQMVTAGHYTTLQEKSWAGGHIPRCISPQSLSQNSYWLCGSRLYPYLVPLSAIPEGQELSALRSGPQSAYGARQ